jgi:hypothetical protein
MFMVASLTPMLEELALDRSNWWPRYERMFMKKAITENSVHKSPSYYAWDCSKPAEECRRFACYWATLEKVPKVPKRLSEGDPVFLFAKRAREVYLKHYPKWDYCLQGLYTKHKRMYEHSKEEMQRLNKIRKYGPLLRSGMEFVDQEEIRLAKRKREEIVSDLQKTLESRKKRLVVSQKRLNDYLRINDQHKNLVRKVELELKRLVDDE